MKKQLNLVFISVLVHQTFASFCGSTGVPFSFEVLPSGAPILGCAQPTCVASLKSKKDDSNFLVNGNGQADGFMRDDDKDSKVYGDPYSSKPIANCSGQFSDLACSRKDQWVGGIEYIDHPRQPLILQCCTFPGLRFSQEVGLTNVGPGEAITGGEVIRNGRQISFDVIANVRKVVDANTHIVSYEVTVRRMHCLPDPPEPVIDFERNVSDEILKVLTRGTDLSTFRKERALKKEKSEELESRKTVPDITTHKTHKTDEKKRYKKTELGEKENVKLDVPNKNEVILKRGDMDVKAEVTMKSDDSQLLAAPFSNHKSEIRSDSITSSFADENRLHFASTYGPVMQEGSKAFGQPQVTVFEQKELQPSLQEPELDFESAQQQTPSQSIQLQQSHTREPCSTHCQQTSCFMQRCNQGLDPVFGIPTFAPPLFPLTFPTLPTLGFPTVAPQTFQPFIAPTYPTIAPPPSQPPLQPLPRYYDPSNSGNAVSFNSPPYFSATDNKRTVNPNGRLMQLSIAPITPTIPSSNAISTQPSMTLSGKPVLLSSNQVSNGQVTLKPLSTFEEFMARLGYHNVSIATLAPAGALIFPPDLTIAPPLTPLSPLLYTTTITPRNQGQMFIPGIDAQLSQPNQNGRSSVLYAPQQWSPKDLDDSMLQRTGLRHL